MTISTWNFLQGGFASGANNLYDFAALKNYAFVTDYGHSKPIAWDGISTAGMAQGYRLSYNYTAKGVQLSFTVNTNDNSILDMAASQPASGLYIGKLMYISGGASEHTEVVSVETFSTTGTAGDTNYFVTQITLSTKVALDRDTASFNGVTITTAASGGSITTTGALTCFKIMAITQMKSGGFRASEEMSVDVINGSAGKILLSDILMDLSFNGTEFGFDIAAMATEWFMTKPFDPQLRPTAPLSAASQIYYKIPLAALSTGLNPMLNSETAFDIIDNVAGTENTTVLEYELEQAYFTEQVDAPRVKFMRVFQNFLCEAGDPCFPSRLWLSELLSPQIWSEFGGTQGSFLDFAPDDGDIITGIKPWSNFLFVFKAHSVFRVEFTGADVTPFTVQQITNHIGALSHFAIQDTDKGIVFLSEKGPAICRGYYVSYVAFEGPQNAVDGLSGVDLLFNSNYSAPLNFNALVYSVSANDTQHRRLWFSVTQGTNDEYRDKALIYDYAHNAWWLNDSVANYYAQVQDANNFIDIWSGNYAAQVFEQESGVVDAPGNPISFSYTMAPIFADISFDWMNGRRLWISGIQNSSSSILSVDATSFPVGNTVTVTFDTSDPKFASGMYVPLPGDAMSTQIRLRHTDNTTLDITGIRLEYENQGPRV